MRVKGGKEKRPIDAEGASGCALAPDLTNNSTGLPAAFVSKSPRVARGGTPEAGVLPGTIVARASRRRSEKCHRPLAAFLSMAGGTPALRKAGPLGEPSLP